MANDSGRVDPIISKLLALRDSTYPLPASEPCRSLILGARGRASKRGGAPAQSLQLLKNALPPHPLPLRPQKSPARPVSWRAMTSTI